MNTRASLRSLTRSADLDEVSRSDTFPLRPLCAKMLDATRSSGNALTVRTTLLYASAPLPKTIQILGRTTLSLPPRLARPLSPFIDLEPSLLSLESTQDNHSLGDDKVHSSSTLLAPTRQSLLRPTASSSADARNAVNTIGGLARPDRPLWTHKMYSCSQVGQRRVSKALHIKTVAA